MNYPYAGKKVTKLTYHGARQGPTTGWMFWPGFTMAALEDGSNVFLGDVCHDTALMMLEARGVLVDEFRKAYDEALAKRLHLVKPEAVEGLYLHHLGYEKPEALFEWDWSTTFGRWGRHVRFADGWDGFTYPKTF